MPVHYSGRDLCEPGRTACWAPVAVVAQHTKIDASIDCPSCKRLVAFHRSYGADLYPHERYRIKLDSHLDTLATDAARVDFLKWQWDRWIGLAKKHAEAPHPKHFMVDFRITLNDILIRIGKYGGRDAQPTLDVKIAGYY
jgi:hypothetical protein